MATDLTLLAPELVLCLGAFLVILLDLAMPGGRSRRPLLYFSLFVAIVACSSFGSEASAEAVETLTLPVSTACTSSGAPCSTTRAAW